MILSILLYLILGILTSSFYIKIFIRFGIPGQRSWPSLIWRVLLSPLFWPVVLFTELVIFCDSS